MQVTSDCCGVDLCRLHNLRLQLSHMTHHPLVQITPVGTWSKGARTNLVLPLVTTQKVNMNPDQTSKLSQKFQSTILPGSYILYIN